MNNRQKQYRYTRPELVRRAVDYLQKNHPVNLPISRDTALLAMVEAAKDLPDGDGILKFMSGSRILVVVDDIKREYRKVIGERINWRPILVDALPRLVEGWSPQELVQRVHDGSFYSCQIPVSLGLDLFSTVQTLKTVQLVHRQGDTVYEIFWLEAGRGVIHLTITQVSKFPGRTFTVNPNHTIYLVALEPPPTVWFGVRYFDRNTWDIDWDLWADEGAPIGSIIGRAYPTPGLKLETYARSLVSHRTRDNHLLGLEKAHRFITDHTWEYIDITHPNVLETEGYRVPGKTLNFLHEKILEVEWETIPYSWEERIGCLVWHPHWGFGEIEGYVPGIVTYQFSVKFYIGGVLPFERARDVFWINPSKRYLIEAFIENPDNSRG